MGKELKLILSRIGVTIIMRELIVMGAKIDIARGLPIIHANFLGYDEHSHRRNPSSKVTFWTLKGTDKSIGEIWKAAELSKKRHYDVWIYSDHGQEYCTPYERKYGHSLSEAVASVIKKRNKKFYKRKINAGIQVKRVGFFRNKPVSNDSFNESINSISEERPFVITALGPLGFLYLIGQMNLKKKRKLAKDLVAKAKIPIVFYRVENNIFVENLRGSLELPRDKEKVFGSHHPFLTNVTEDMIELCMHQNSGDFVLSGYNLFGKSLSFVMEYGAHGGPGRYETEGFLLVPGRAACFSQANDSIRPIDLREGVISYLNQETNFSEVSLKEKKIV